MPNSAATFSDIQSRLKVADQGQLALNVLDMAMALSLSKSVLPLDRPARTILSEAMSRLHEILPWEGMAFYLSQGDDFHLKLCHPKDNSSIVARQIRSLIQNGVFALSVRGAHPVTSYDSKEGQRLILGPIIFNDKLKGVFLGSLRVESSPPSALLLSLIKLVLGCCAESLERSSQFGSLRNKYSYLQRASDALAILSLTKKGELSSVSSQAAKWLGIDESNAWDKSLANYLLLPEDVSFPIRSPLEMKVKLRSKSEELKLHLLPGAEESAIGVLLPISGLRD